MEAVRAASDHPDQSPYQTVSLGHRPSIFRRDSVDESLLPEGEKAMMEAKKRQEDQEDAKFQEYGEQRRLEREREDQELCLLKEKREQRRLKERKARLEEERIQKEEALRKRQQLMGGGIMGTPFIGSERPIFVIPSKNDKIYRFGNIMQAMKETEMTSEQQEEAKLNFLEARTKSLDVTDLSGNELKAKIHTMHQRICKLEGVKYNLEKRHERQIYDLREMKARERYYMPKRSRRDLYPPKIAVSSKYDRQVDRRDFKERKNVFDKMR
ncbi:troponin domain-containing protein [Ditylenchus destructor]|nr:troponin domain-containing protein [Ditylenchus destructor]